MKYAICNMLPSKKRVTMETNFQNTKIDHFKHKYLFIEKMYMNDTYCA